MPLKPLNDLAKVELDGDEFGWAGTTKDTAESGILVSLPDKFVFFGYWSFAFENSFMNYHNLDRLHKHYQKLLGKKVYWTALSEKGNIIQEITKDKSGKKVKKSYAYVKLTSLIAAGEPDVEARNIHSDGAGGFRA